MKSNTVLNIISRDTILAQNIISSQLDHFNSLKIGVLVSALIPSLPYSTLLPVRLRSSNHKPYHVILCLKPINVLSLLLEENPVFTMTYQFHMIWFCLRAYPHLMPLSSFIHNFLCMLYKISDIILIL